MSSSAGSDSASGGGREAYGAGGQYSGGGTTSTPSGGGDGGDAREQYGAVGQYEAPSPTPSGGGDDAREQYLTTQYPTLTQAEIEKGITETGEILDEKVQRESLVEKALDLYQKYSPLGIAINLGGSLIDSLGTASKSLQNKL